MSKIFDFIKKPFKSYLRAFLILLFIFIVLFVTVITICSLNGGFFHLNTDDVVQYYPIMASFIEKVKTGNVSLFNASFFHGGSEFANAYYVPLDIFTILTLLFSYVMRTETAYCVVNMLKLVLSGLLFFYVLRKQGFKPKTCFISALIYSFGGLYAAFCVFPVYLSIMFYLPLAVYTADRFRENKYNFVLIVLYTVLVIFYDFYIAYMLLAFLMIYLVVRCYSKDDFTLIGKKSFIKNKKFYQNIVLALFLIVIGLGISMAYFLPNYAYITGKTYRVVVKEILTHYNIKHYLIIFSTFFLTSNPQTILLGHGDYIRNHASMFFTVYGFIFLIQFLFMRGKENNRLKIFVILLNVLLCIPLVSMIMTASSQAYIRWYFIVYFINLYVATITMEKLDFNPAKTWYNKLITCIVLLVGLIFITYLYFISNDYTLYNNHVYFHPVIIVFLVTIGLYTLSLLFKYKINKHAFTIIAVAECITSIVLVLVNVDNTNSYYYHSRDTLDSIYDNLNENTSYTKTNAYRAVVDSYEATYLTNMSFLYDKVNTANFFHSFYDATANEFYSDFLGESTSSWSKRESVMYSMPFALLNGVKYHVVPKWHNVTLPDIYELKHDDGTFLYYEIKDMKPFIVYDEFVDSISKYRVYDKGMIMSNYGLFTDAIDSDFKTNLFDKYNLKTVEADVAKAYSCNGNQRTISGTVEEIDGIKYVKYDLSSYTAINGADTLSFYINSQGYRDNGYTDAYILDTEGEKHYLYYGTTGYDGSYTPQFLYMKTYSNAFSLNYASYDLDEFYNTYLDNQDEYENQEFILDKNSMTIKLNCKASSYGRIIKTNFSYSDEWKINNSNFETVNILGGYLGIVIPPNTTTVDLKLTFIPNQMNLGITVSCFTFSLFTIVSTCIFVTLRRKHK